MINKAIAVIVFFTTTTTTTAITTAAAILRDISSTEISDLPTVSIKACTRKIKRFECS